jgi:hypothetical protein
MSHQEPLRPLSELPLPAIAPALSASIREEAHRRLAAAHENRRRARRPRSAFGVFTAAAVVVLCVSHLGWTVVFLTRMHEPVVSGSAAGR